MVHSSPSGTTLSSSQKPHPTGSSSRCTKRESTTGMIFHIHQMQHLINTKIIDVGYQQHSNYLITLKKKKKEQGRSSMMDPPTTGIKRWWLGHESHLSTKGVITCLQTNMHYNVICLRLGLLIPGCKSTVINIYDMYIYLHMYVCILKHNLF